MKKFRAAIIGCGAIHSIHADAISKCPDVELAAVVDIDGQRAREAASRYACSFYTDYAEALKEPQIDTVHICTPHWLHARMAIDSMRSGKHILVEKPAAIHSSDVREMIRVSAETGKSLGICFQNRYNTTSAKIKEILESGKAGRVLGAKAIVTWRRDADYYRSGSWRGTWKEEGGGVLINQAIHTLDLLQWFLGDIEKLKGNADTRLLEGVIEVEDTADAAIVFKNGASAIFYATNNHVSDSPVELEIICEKAILRLAGELTVSYKDGQTEIVSETDIRTGEKSYWGCGHSILIDDFYKKLGAGESFWIDGGEGIKTIRMIEAIYESTKTREFIKF